MKVAVIGSGISGLGAAWALRNTADVALYEADGRLGGHSNTATVDYGGASIDVDTGFIVYNELVYRNLTPFFDHLGVVTEKSDMSLSVCSGPTLEWSSDVPTGVFAWKRSLLDADHWAMLRDMARFNARAQADNGSPDLEHMTLRDYIARTGVGRAVVERYIVPMGAAIWSTPHEEMLDYPAASFVRFFNNHRLLHAQRPIWRTVTGGSKRYVARIAADLGPRVRLATPVVAVEPGARGVTVRDANGGADRFDHVILACHSDDALRLIAGPTAEEADLLGAIRYGDNEAVLHRDASLMPSRRAAWASWNVAQARPGAPVTLTYWMNRLQNLDRARPLFVTLNPQIQPAQDAVFARYAYRHPLFTRAAMAAQRLLPSIQGVRGLWFAGAWCGYGFHEDGLASGLRVALRLGGQVPWDFAEDGIERAPWAESAAAPARIAGAAL